MDLISKILSVFYCSGTFSTLRFFEIVFLATMKPILKKKEKKKTYFGWEQILVFLLIDGNVWRNGYDGSNKQEYVWM